jgi:competence protein ComEA
MDEPAAPWRVLEATSADLGLAAQASDGPGRPDPRRWIAAASIGGAIVLGLLAVWIATGGPAATVEVSGAEPVESGAHDSGPSPAVRGGGTLVIDVQGAVAHPGVVRLVEGSRIGDAIAAAGGYSPRVATDRIGRSLNLAALLHDGDQVVVPSRDDAPGGETAGGLVPSGGASGATAGSGAPGAPIDLNEATTEQLDGLPGIGPVTAAKILAARAEQRFTSVDDLRSRKLVGPATFDKIKALVTVR